MWIVTFYYKQVDRSYELAFPLLRMMLYAIGATSADSIRIQYKGVK